MIGPLYLSEISPAALRGRLVTMQVVLITFGQVLAYIVGAILYNFSHAWRWVCLLLGTCVIYSGFWIDASVLCSTSPDAAYSFYILTRVSPVPGERSISPLKGSPYGNVTI